MFQKRDKIDLMEYLCYGLGDFSFCFIYGAIGSYIVYFYTDVACISAAVVGTILLSQQDLRWNFRYADGLYH